MLKKKVFKILFLWHFLASFMAEKRQKKWHQMLFLAGNFISASNLIWFY